MWISVLIYSLFMSTNMKESTANAVANDDKKGTLLYVFDPLCGWCFGFTPVMESLEKKYSQHLNFEVISGGMVPESHKEPISRMSSYILGAIPRVEEYSGVKFGEPYKDLLKKGEYMSNSEPPARALTLFKRLKPELSAVEFAHKIQNIMFVEGKDFNNDSVYAELAESYGLNGAEFVKLLHSEENIKASKSEFTFAKSLGVTGYPAVLYIKDSTAYKVSNGFTSEKDIDDVIQYIINKKD